MIHTYRFLIVLLCILCSTPSVLSQSVNQKVKDVVMPAPNAAALGKYGEIPVSYYTGVPNISIPITTVQEGPLSLSVGLSYHASGVKVGEMASWVGMGWVLNAGGMITRTIQGLPDEVSPTGYYYTGKLLVGNGGDRGKQQTTWSNLASGQYDGEPDLYSFTADDISGKFYINRDGAFIMVPLQDLKITYADEKAHDHGFIITKPDGKRYIFGKIPGGSTPVKESTTLSDESTPTVSSWYLVRVETDNKLFQINLSYVAESYSYKSLATCRKQASSCVTGNGSAGGGGYYCSTENGYDESHHYITANMNAMRLNTIKTGSGTTVVSFRIREDSNGKPIPSYAREDLDAGSNGSQSYPLYAIEVGTGSATYCSRYEFAYSYFEDTNTKVIGRSEAKRLKLTQLQELSCSKETAYTKPPTKFTYNGAVNNGKQFLPQRLSKAIDHWGFYNGSIDNETERINVPTSSVVGVQYTSRVNRESSEINMKLGVLEKIEYPTGGSTQFAYQANTYNKEEDGAPVFKKLDGTIQELKTATTPYETRNCGPRTIPSTTNVTFTTDNEILQARFKLYLTSAYGTECEFSSDKIAKMSVYNATTNTQVGSSFGFNASEFLGGRTDGNITKKFSEVGIKLQKNVPYKFVLYSRDGMGKLEVFTIPRVLVIAKAGGLRVSSITSYDGISTSNNIIKTYDYNTSSTASSGKLIYRPTYAYNVSGIVLVNDQPPYNYGGTIDAIFFDENSIVPLSSFEGYHIGYSRVRESLNGNGYTIYEYDNPEDPIANFSSAYPRPPHSLNVNRGSLYKEKKFTQSGTYEIASITNVPFSTSYTESADPIIRVSAPFRCVSAFSTNTGGPPSYATSAFITQYSIRTGALKMQSKIEVLDGVSTTTSYTYGSSYLHPKTVATTNSDNKVTTMTYIYPYELASSAVRTALVDRFIVGVPVETKVVVGSTTIGGDKTAYSLFSRTTGLPVSSGTDVDVFPYKFYDYEMTWEGTTVKTGDYVLKGTIDSYYKSTESGKAYPKQYTATNWPTETYEWDNGLIKKRTYKEYVWKYSYISSTRLLSSITDIDLQTTSYTYDKLQRLKTISARSAAVVTTYDYHYTASTVAADKNYVKSSTTYTAVSGSSLTNRTSWQYLDGLGRPLQTVDQKHSPSQKDIITAVQYDNQGRIVRTYNPFETTNTSGAFTAVPSGTKYTLTGYEASPLSRVSTVTPPDWYATTTTYSANAANEVLLNGSTSVYYAANLLSKVTTTDPTANKSITYTDKKGRVILSRRSGTSSADVANTYSLYDDKDRLKMVVPPGATVSTTGLTFQYTYDRANNLLTKKVPDAALVAYKYNTRDQPVLMQDGNLLADNKKWIASRYDDYGRLTATGYWSGTVPSPISPTGLSITAANELTKSYYDGYDGGDTLDLAANPQYRGKVRKLLAKVLDGSSTATWLHTTYTYDKQGRLTGTTGNNYQNPSAAAAESVTMTYDWADNPLTQRRVHKPSSSLTRTLAYRNTYDGAGRRAAYYLKVDSGTEQLLASYGYDERDLLRTRSLHGTPITLTSPVDPDPIQPAITLSSEVGMPELESITLGGAGTPMSYLQRLDYTYNTQGWLTAINQLAASGTSTGIKVAPTGVALPNPGAPSSRVSGVADDIFGLELKYDVLQSGLSGTARKDGNIAQVIWRTRGRERQAYSASYDYLSRMSTASYYDLTDAGTASSDQKFSEAVTYADARGNIKTLKRNGLYPSGSAWAVGQIDNLTYGYTSGTNQLATVTEAASNSAAKPFGFNPGAGGTGYGYDQNGNLTKDTYKGITAITYNYLNLPTKISFGSSKSITFTYDATGRKLRKVTAGGAGAENYTQHYADGLEYRGTTLEAIYHEEGRLTPKTSTTWQYEYSIRDHLGNTRVTFADKDGDGKINVTNTSANEVLQENHYTPFGLELGYAWMNDAALVDSKYRFGGKEFNADFGLKLNDYGARWYDPAVARWTSVDPMADEYHNLPLSPYNYVANNPISNVDPDGMDWFRNNDTGEEYWEDRTDANEGETSLGAWNIVEGKNGYVIHHQQNVVGSVSKSEEGAYDQALAREVQGMSSQEFSDGFSDRDAEAIYQMPGLISEALLTYGNTPKAAKASAFAPAFTARSLAQKLVQSANVADRAGLTKIGRALQKHGSRAGSKFPRATGNSAQMNQQGSKVLNDIINSPGSTTTLRHHARFGNVLEIRGANGQGARFSADGQTFIGLLE